MMKKTSSFKVMALPFALLIALPIYAIPVFAQTAAAPVAAPAQAVPNSAASYTNMSSAGASPTDNKLTVAPVQALQAPVTAADVKQQKQFIQSYRKCLDTETRIARLSCYDQIAEDMNLIPYSQKTKEDQIIGTYGFWKVIFEKDELGNEKTLVELPTSTPVINASGLSTRPTLTLSCALEKTDLYLNYQYELNQSTRRTTLPVGFSIDGFPAVAQEWTLSGDNYAIYSPDPARMIRALKDHVKMIMTATTEGEGTSHMTFDLPGFNEVLNIMVRRCYPQGPNPTATMQSVAPGKSTLVPKTQ